VNVHERLATAHFRPINFDDPRYSQIACWYLPYNVGRSPEDFFACLENFSGMVLENDPVDLLVHIHSTTNSMWI